MITHDSSDGTVERETVRAVSKILLGAGSLVFVAYLLTLLPGVGRLVPRTPVTFAALIGSVVSLAVVALLLSVAPRLAALARMSLDGPADIVENAASLVYWLTVLAAVLIAHAGLSGTVRPLVGGVGWLYDLVFLLLALPAVAIVAARLYASLDPTAELLADRVAGRNESAAGPDDP
ncbi:hypothetical protein GRX03_00320 [Halovenus sp. WSH3]|uniref:Uncharacterized protein n=1 Tax=Halovenus carboxidivorans TaxID=2692199 RepID=A0A6B0SWY0_9EURY|nr:hypothetical protein [Halovenus carboxidivorans]MXR50054.1 hypothetical protein [Halovenus carboxidivorans]